MPAKMAEIRNSGHTHTHAHTHTHTRTQTCYQLEIDADQLAEICATIIGSDAVRNPAYIFFLFHNLIVFTRAALLFAGPAIEAATKERVSVQLTKCVE